MFLHETVYTERFLQTLSCADCFSNVLFRSACEEIIVATSRARQNRIGGGDYNPVHRSSQQTADFSNTGPSSNPETPQRQFLFFFIQLVVGWYFFVGIP